MIFKKIIVISLLLTFLCNAFAKDQESNAQYPTPNALWIVSDLAGKSFQPGDTCEFQVMAPDNYTGTYNINLRNRESPSGGGTLLSGVSFKPGLNTFELAIPETVPGPYYYINFWGPTREDYSATFTIGDPGYGVSIVEPAAGTIIHPGDTLIANWYGTYEKPGVKGIKFIHALLELAVNNNTRSYPFQADRDITFESQHFEFQLPDDLLTHRVWKFGFLFNTSDGNYNTIVS
ncbi:12379_t:CDS:2, partial [Dentiscutata erythropus]